MEGGGDVSSSLRLLKQKMVSSRTERRAMTPVEAEDAIVVATTPQARAPSSYSPAMDASSTASAAVEEKAPPPSMEAADPPPLPPSRLAAPPRAQSMAGAPRPSKHALRWVCNYCSKECIPIRSESRCLCGHRYKEHEQGNAQHNCRSKGCPCAAFFFIVAEGAWVLRCACKHRHNEHDPSGPPFKCIKKACSCTGFHSPWCCNCDHPWSEHRQEAYIRSSLVADAQLQDMMVADTIKRTDTSTPLPGLHSKMQL